MKKLTPKRIASAALWMVILPAAVIAQLIRGEKPSNIKKCTR